MTVKNTLTLMFMACALSAHALDNYENIPQPGANARVGALMPYTRYDSQDAILNGGANLKVSTNYDPRNIATQASERSYISLPNAGAYAEWTAVRSGNGVTLRFTLPDATDKDNTNGLRGSLELYINGEKRKIRVYGETKDKIELSSYWAWQYYDATHTDNASDTYIQGAIPCFAFDETGFIVEGDINKGDKIRIVSTGDNGLEYGVDFLEIEKVTKIEQPANSISAAGYGSIVDAANAAQNQGKTLYIPEGRYNIGGKWYLPGGVKITGAGMFYTDVFFTSANAGGGGVVCSGGSELRDLHLNTNLHSRHLQKANYKGLEGGPNGFKAYNLWIQHFECGAWFELGDNIKVVNCRLRDNIADGLNFCRATSNSTVYNCSVRNNGDDQLAMWNHNWQCGDESNNTFCYNTIELGWRAGQLGVFGGNNHKIYNNYIRDGVLSAGIRVNTDFPGYGFQNTQRIDFKNNYVIGCGTTQDIFGGNLAAVFVCSSNRKGAGDVRNVYFENTQIYNSQTNDIVTESNIPITNNRQATVPGYPEVDDTEPASGGVLDGISGYDLIIDALAWKNAEGKSELEQGDKVTFTARIKNNSDVDIPEGVIIGMGINIDGNDNLINNSYNGGLAAGSDLILTAEWTATAGGHTVTATADPNNRLPEEKDENNNTRVKKLNVKAVENSVNKGYTPVTGGYDLYVTDVTFENITRKDGTIHTGDHIRFTAIGVNAGDKATPSEVKHGVQFQVDNKGYNDAPITWSDKFKGPMGVHEFHYFKANSGGSQSGIGNDQDYWTATEGTHTVTAWIDDSNEEELRSEVNKNNNKTTVTLPTIPYNGVKYIDNPDQPDNLDGSTTEPEPVETEAVIKMTGKYGTFCCTHDLDFSNVSGLKAYIATTTTRNGDVMVLTIQEAKDIPATEGIMLITDNGQPGEFHVPYGKTNVLAMTNLFKGTTVDTYIYGEKDGKINFILANGSQGIGFYKAEDGTLPAGKAYLPLKATAASNAKAVRFVTDDETTGINGITGDENNTDGMPYYTLTGIRTDKPVKGVYIRGGKKVIIK